MIADIDQGRVDFAVKSGFAHRGFVVPQKRGRTIEEKLEIAKQTAALAAQMGKPAGGVVGEVDAVFECTGVEACLQAAIYVTYTDSIAFTSADGNRLHDLAGR